MFVAAIISVEACKSGIWVAAILAWIVAGIIIGLAIISDYKKAELLKMEQESSERLQQQNEYI